MVSDTRGREEMESILNADSAPSSLLIEGGGHTVGFFLQADLILVSPGIPLDLPPLSAAREKGIPIQGELELFSRYCRTPIIGRDRDQWENDHHGLDQRNAAGGRIFRPFWAEI